jgi:hypothetical protein
MFFTFGGSFESTNLKILLTLLVMTILEIPSSYAGTFSLTYSNVQAF